MLGPDSLLAPVKLSELKRLCDVSVWKGSTGGDPFAEIDDLAGECVDNCYDALERLEVDYKANGQGGSCRTNCGGPDACNEHTVPTLKWALSTNYWRSVPLVESIVVAITGSRANIANTLWSAAYAETAPPATMSGAMLGILSEEQLKVIAKECFPSYRVGKHQEDNLWDLSTSHKELDQLYDGAFVLLDAAVPRVIFGAFVWD